MRFIVLVPLLMALVAAFVSGMGISFKTLQMSIMGTTNAGCSSSPDPGPAFNCSNRAPGTYIANMSDCAAYCKCEGNTSCCTYCTYELNNPSNVYVFSTDTKSCMPYNNNTNDICGSRTYVDRSSASITDVEPPTTAVPAAAVPTSADCKCFNPSGLFPLAVKNPCGTYFCQCSNASPTLQGCSAELAYNPRTCVCDWGKSTYAQPCNSSSAPPPPSP